MTGRLRLGACLSLSGRFARFGGQAAWGLETWRSLTGDVDLVIEDDRSEPGVLSAALDDVSTRCDLLLGPYSTLLMRTAGAVAAETGRLLWNHGGSGDDVEGAHPGHVVSVPTPASRYAVSFVRRLAHESAHDPYGGPLWIASGKGAFGRQVAEGAAREARALGVRTVRLGPDERLPNDPPGGWDLLSAGGFAEDTARVRNALSLPIQPRTVCSVAAGVREFGEAVHDPTGVFGIGQWAPGGAAAAEIGPAETDLLAAYTEWTGTRPDYPAVQAVAAAVLATHCARLTGGTSRKALWAAAGALETTTVFGAFRIDAEGVQTGHAPVLVRWAGDGLVVPVEGR
jgi:hypothetical protein